MMTYTLTLVFTDGQKEELTLGKPHTLATTPTAALLWEDGEGRTHNVPLSALRDFYFHPTNYALCRNHNASTLDLPTRGCTCDECKAKLEKIKKAANEI